MVFFILAILASLLFFVFKTYRTLYAVIIAVLFILGITTAVLIWGMGVYSQGTRLSFFSSEIGSREFYHLIAAWYGADILCSVLIFKSFRAYKKINSGNDRRSDKPGAVQ